MDQNDVWDIAESAASQSASPHWATVASYNPADHTATVTSYHGDTTTTLSQELPIALMGGMRYAPRIGQQAWVVPDSQDASQMVISGFAFNDLDRPPITNNAISGSPVALNPGEFEVIGARASNHRFNEDGSIFVSSPTGHNIQSPITSLGDVNHDGNLVATKNTTIGTGWTGSFTSSTGQIITVNNGIITNVA